MGTKQVTILREIGFKHHPAWMKTSITTQRQMLALADITPRSINAEAIVEDSLAHRGKYNFVNAIAMDFDDIDESDSKTGTVNINTKKVEIGSIGNKIGALRIIVWNPILDTLDYFFLPYAVWKFSYAVKCYGKNTEGKLRLVMSWNKDKNHYNKFEIFRLASFEDLATMTEEQFYLLHPEFLHLTQNELNISLPNLDSVLDSKIETIQQIPNPCTLVSDLQQSLNFGDTQPTSPFLIS